MARALLRGNLGQIDSGRVREPERLGYCERSIDELGLWREQIDPYTRAGEPVPGEQGLEPRHAAAGDDDVERRLTAPIDHGDAHVASLFTGWRRSSGVRRRSATGNPRWRVSRARLR